MGQNNMPTAKITRWLTGAAVVRLDYAKAGTKTQLKLTLYPVGLDTQNKVVVFTDHPAQPLITSKGKTKPLDLTVNVEKPCPGFTSETWLVPYRPGWHEVTEASAAPAGSLLATDPTYQGMVDAGLMPAWERCLSNGGKMVTPLVNQHLRGSSSVAAVITRLVETHSELDVPETRLTPDTPNLLIPETGLTLDAAQLR